MLSMSVSLYYREGDTIASVYLLFEPYYIPFRFISLIRVCRLEYTEKLSLALAFVYERLN